MGTGVACAQPTGGGDVFVFGPSGQMYRGGPENLSQIAAVRRVETAHRRCARAP